MTRILSMALERPKVQTCLTVFYRACYSLLPTPYTIQGDTVLSGNNSEMARASGHFLYCLFGKNRKYLALIKEIAWKTSCLQ